jgi:hypothetical protein
MKDVRGLKGFHYKLVCVCVFNEVFLLLCISSARGYFPFNPYSNFSIFGVSAHTDRERWAFWWMNVIKIFIAFQHPPTAPYFIERKTNSFSFNIFFSWSSLIWSSFYIQFRWMRTFSIIQCFHLGWRMIKLMFKFFKKKVL